MQCERGDAGATSPWRSKVRISRMTMRVSKAKDAQAAGQRIVVFRIGDRELGHRGPLLAPRILAPANLPGAGQRGNPANHR